MKKIIILLLTLLMSACSAVKPAETLSSMQTEPMAETTVTETAAPEETTETAPKETDTVIETPKLETTVPSATESPEQKPVPDTTTKTIAETPIAPIETETAPKPPTAQEMPIETVEEDKPTEIPETVITPPESVTEPPKAAFDINYWISFTRSYALQIGLEIDPTAVDCWDNPTTANADCIYLERDLTHRLDRYNRDDDEFLEDEETEQA